MQTLSAIALVVSIASVLFTGWAAFATARQAKSARDQTKIQKEQVEAAREQTTLQRLLAREALQPYVWADLQPDMKQGTVLDLVVGNSGPTVATDIRVTFDPALPVSPNWQGDVVRLQNTLANGLHSLAPHREIRWSLGTSPDLMAEDRPQLVQIRIDANGPHGRLPELVVPVDISQWRQSKDAPDGSLHHVRKSIQDLSGAVEKAARTVARPALQVQQAEGKRRPAKMPRGR